MKEASKVTTHYWGFRELTPEELLLVGGGDGDGGDAGDGGGCGAGDCGGNDGAAAVADGGSVCTAIGETVGVAVTGACMVGTEGLAGIAVCAALGTLAATIATASCNGVTGNGGTAVASGDGYGGYAWGGDAP